MVDAPEKSGFRGARLAPYIVPFATDGASWAVGSMNGDRGGHALELWNFLPYAHLIFKMLTGTMSQSRSGRAGCPDEPKPSLSPAKNSPRYLRPVAAGAEGNRRTWLSGGGDGGGGGGVNGGRGGGAGGA